MKLFKSIVVVLLALCLVACTSSKQEETVVEEKETLYMATEATFPPYEFLDGTEIVGIDVDIAKAIAEKIGKNLVVEDIAFDSIVPSVKTGKYDFAAAGMTVNEERLTQVNFTDSYATGVQVVIVKEDSDITSINDIFDGKIKDLKVGTQDGTTGFIYASDDIEATGLGEVKSFPKTTEAATALVNDQIDCIILDNEPAKVIVEKNPGLKILDTEYVSENYAIAVAKENTELLEQMNSALNELIADGTVASIINNYIGD